MFGLQDYESNEVGQLNGSKNFHYPFKLTNVDIFNKHHKSHNRSTDGIPPEYKRYNQKQYDSVTNQMNNLQNFNCTRGSEKQQFQHHETHKHMFQMNPSHKRYLEVFNKNTDIPDKINAMKKFGKHFQKYPEHSSFLTPSKGR